MTKVATKATKVTKVTKVTKISDLPNFDLADYLKTEEDIAGYLSIVLEDDDAGEFAHALGVVARARSMTQLAKDTGLSREGLYKSLSGERAPSADTLLKVIKALGFKLTITPAAHA